MFSKWEKRKSFRKDSLSPRCRGAGEQHGPVPRKLHARTRPGTGVSSSRLPSQAQGLEGPGITSKSRPGTSRWSCSPGPSAAARCLGCVEPAGTCVPNGSSGLSRCVPPRGSGHPDHLGLAVPRKGRAGSLEEGI